jgi:PAS domain S-box-containing protein
MRWQKAQVSESSPLPDHEVAGADFFRALVNVLPGVVYQSRISPDGQAKVEYVSEAARWFLECEPEEIIRDVRVFHDLIHPEDREMFTTRLRARLLVPGPWQLEYRLLLPSGRVRWISSQASIVALPDGGTMWRGFFTDMTGRMLAEKELQAERERLALATRAGRVGTWDYDVRTKAIQWNDEMFAIHGVTRENYTPGETNYEFLAPEDRTRVRQEFELCLASGAHHYAIDVTLILPDGQRRLTRSQALILRDAYGEATRVVGIEMDVTEEKQAEADMVRARATAELADKAKSEFLATMSHEIRTPLNGILGYTDLLKTPALDSQQREFLETIESSGDHLLEVINDVLDVSRIEAGKMQIELAPFDVRDCVREIFEMLRPAATGKGLAYVCEIDPQLPTGMISDRGRVAQVLTNILGNAIKFTDSGEVRLEVSAFPGEKWNWKFRVTDTGPGIAPAALEQIFQPFYQADGSAGRRHGGTGLGLTISRRMAELLDGTLLVENRAGGGSEFILALRAASVKGLRESAPADAIATILSPLRVLLAEDNPVNRRLCEIQLRRIGCEPAFAANGREAVDLFQAQPFDVVLMDMQMPGMDGCEATRAIRSFEQARGGSRTPIVAMTANVRTEDRQRCLDSGMDDYLSKPFRQENLAAMLEKWGTKPAG